MELDEDSYERALAGHPRQLKRYREFRQELRSVLRAFEAFRDWADLIKVGLRLNKCIKRHLREVRSLPEQVWFFKRLGQCLNPALPSGVHKNVLETVDLIFSILGPEGLAASLPIYLPGIFLLFPNAQMEVRPIILGLVDKYFLPLPSPGLAGCLSGLLCSLLPTLEDEGSRERHAVLTLLQRLQGKLREDNMGALFHLHLWDAVRLSGSCRVGGLAYLEKLGRPPLPRSSKEREKSALDPEQLGGDAELVVAALDACLSAHRQDLQLRGALDLMHAAFMAHEAPEALGAEGAVRLTRRMLGLYARGELPLTRRVVRWLDGEDRVSPEYFDRHSRKLVVAAMRQMLDDACAEAPRTLEPAATALKVIELLSERPGILSALTHWIARLLVSFPNPQHSLALRALGVLGPLTCRFVAERLRLAAGREEEEEDDGADEVPVEPPPSPNDLPLVLGLVRVHHASGLDTPPTQFLSVLEAGVAAASAGVRRGDEALLKTAAMVLVTTLEEGGSKVASECPRRYTDFLGELLVVAPHAFRFASDEEMAAMFRSTGPGTAQTQSVDDLPPLTESACALVSCALRVAGATNSEELDAVRVVGESPNFVTVLMQLCEDKGVWWIDFARLAIELFIAREPALLPLPVLEQSWARGEPRRVCELLWEALDSDCSTNYSVAALLLKLAGSSQGAEVVAAVQLEGLRHEGGLELHVSESGFRRFCALWRITEAIEEADPDTFRQPVEVLLNTLRSESPLQRQRCVSFLRECVPNLPRLLEPMLCALERKEPRAVHLLHLVFLHAPEVFLSRAISSHGSHLPRAAALAATVAEEGAGDDGELALQAAQLLLVLLSRGKACRPPGKEFPTCCRQIIPPCLRALTVAQTHHPALALELGKVLLTGMQGAAASSRDVGEWRRDRRGRSSGRDGAPSPPRTSPGGRDLPKSIVNALRSASLNPGHGWGSRISFFGEWCALVLDFVPVLQKDGMLEVYAQELLPALGEVVEQTLSRGEGATLTDLLVAEEAIDTAASFCDTILMPDRNKRQPKVEAGFLTRIWNSEAEFEPVPRVSPSVLRAFGREVRAIVKWVVAMLEMTQGEGSTMRSRKQSLRHSLSNLLSVIGRDGDEFMECVLALWAAEEGQLTGSLTKGEKAILEMVPLTEQISPPVLATILAYPERRRKTNEVYALHMLEQLFVKWGEDSSWLDIGKRMQAVLGPVLFWLRETGSRSPLVASMGLRLLDRTLQVVQKRCPKLLDEKRSARDIGDLAGRMLEGVCRLTGSGDAKRGEMLLHALRITTLALHTEPGQKPRPTLTRLFPVDGQQALAFALHQQSLSITLRGDSNARTSSLRLLIAVVRGLEQSGKALRDPLLQHVHDSDFFRVSKSTLALWRELFAMLVSSSDVHSCEMLEAMVRSISLPSGMDSMFGNAAKQADTRAKGLRRLAFLVLCVNHLSNATVLAQILHKMIESVKSYSDPVVLQQVFLTFRAVLVKVDARHLTSFWPPMVAELLRVFGTPGNGHECARRELVREALRVIDWFAAAAPQDFHAYRWLLVSPPALPGKPDSFTSLLRMARDSDEARPAEGATWTPGDVVGLLTSAVLGCDALADVLPHSARRRDGGLDVAYCSELILADLAEEVDVDLDVPDLTLTLSIQAPSFTPSAHLEKPTSSPQPETRERRRTAPPGPSPKLALPRVAASGGSRSGKSGSNSPIREEPAGDWQRRSSASPTTDEALSPPDSEIEVRNGSMTTPGGSSRGREGRMSDSRERSSPRASSREQRSPTRNNSGRKKRKPHAALGARTTSIVNEQTGEVTERWSPSC
eukprot:Hpha_TRINITY_DN12673_c0_g1::TRINITY_DN12673_c0_g1_i1::g.49727::m.49727